MKVLVLGGTSFIGPHIVRKLQSAGHDVTIFNRGKTPHDLTDVTELVGDRHGPDVSALEGLSFDATIDVSGYFPRAINVVLDALEDPGFFAYVSTLSVYADFSKSDQDESAPLATIDDPTVEEITGETYGALKVLCEQVVEARCPEHAHLRLGLVVGPGDVTDRFTYWPVRVSRGGTMIAPGSPDDAMQFVDVRDVADFALHVIENRVQGTFNMVTSSGSVTVGKLLETCERVTNAKPDYVWLLPADLKEHELTPWVDLPAWLPNEGETAGFARFDTTNAQANGFKTRTLETTVQDIWDWWNARPTENQELSRGLKAMQEAEIIAAH